MKHILALILLIAFSTSCSKKTTMPENNTKPNALFTNTRWKLMKMPGMELPQMNDVFIRFYDGKSTGSSGCNRFTGSYESATADKLKLGPQAGTRMMCTAEIMKVEDAFLKALSNADGYLISGDHMQLKKGDDLLAEFEALYL
ncbi:META domain-containing protein [Pollutibacter soli]|uniref:META domain-containing protein n=1 Tax=Pollutibacter soli TaxID=3034157 RepID=UPI0030134BA5